MDIQGYIHCKTCMRDGHSDNLEVGVGDPHTLIIHCSVCDQDVGTFKLAEPLGKMTCDTCGEPLGPNHKH